MQRKEKAKVVDLGKEKYKRLVLDAFDKMQRQDQRERTDKKAEVEREARKKF